MFETLSNNIAKALKNLRGQSKVTELNIASTIKDIRRALIEADVSYKVAKKITEDIKTQTLGKEVLMAVSPGQLFTKIVSDQLTKIMGSQNAALNLKGKPAVVLMAGLQGSGKTTFCGKLAHYIAKKGQNVLLIACDVYRPAAIEQLKTLGNQVSVEVFAKLDSKDVLLIAKEGLAYAQQTNKQVVIIDTAGRQTVDIALMEEIKALQKQVQPAETLLVVDVMVGQDALITAQAFHDYLQFDGIVLTKLDGDTRGGATLSIRAVVDKPIKFIGTGEKINDIDLFYPDRMAQRILGMGDVVSLVEKAEAVYDEEAARKLNQKIRKNQFNLDDFYEQMQQLKKMGNLQDLVKMIPGMTGLAPKVGQLQQDNFKKFEILISSMTPQERANPSIITLNRRIRVAKGSGMLLEEVNKLMKQFEALCKMMKKSQQKSISDILPFPHKLK